jgi:putative CRISPR-associated protein (TIGR02619 family)
VQYILTSCGLSILTNYLKKFDISPNSVYKYSNKQKGEIDIDFLKIFEQHIKTLKKDIVTYDDKQLQKISAELNALIRFMNDNFDKKDFHLLLHTDTYFGSVSAGIIQVLLQSKGLVVEKYLAKDLKTSDIESFQLALSDVVKDLSSVLVDFKDKGYEIIFNLTGGFKSVNSFLQTMASLYADKSIYVFETSDELLYIPRMPIKIDENIFVTNIKLFRLLDIETNLPKSIDKLPKTLVMKIGDSFTLSPWGEIVWQKFKAEYYKSNLLEPISQKIEFSKEFKNDFEQLSPNEKFQFNKSLDKLERYCYDKTNLKSLRYHSLTGKISQQYSHEFYAFDGDDSRRAYCNEKNEKIILEKIGSHLK